MSWDRTHKHRPLLAFTTTNSMLSASSPTAAPPSLIGRRDRQQDWEGSFNSRSSHGSSMEKPQAVCEDKCGGLHCLFYQHIAVWPRYMDYAGQESRFNTFHLRSIRRILGISWLDKVTNADVLSRAGLPSMYTLLRQRRLRWLGHVRRMDDGRIPKYILYGELALGSRTTGHHHLRYKDVCVRDMKAVDIDHMFWEGLAADHTKWRSALK